MEDFRALSKLLTEMRWPSYGTERLYCSTNMADTSGSGRSSKGTAVCGVNCFSESGCFSQ